MARALVTRPAEDSAALAEALRARGLEPLLDPMLRVEPTEGEMPSLDGVQAVLFTSSNGVRAFAQRSERRDVPVYAVGDTTANAARQAGFTDVTSAGGDSAALARLVGERLTPSDGALLHARGADAAGDLAGALGAAGFEVRAAELYRARPAERLSDETRRALAEGTLDAALFYSPRTAETFVALARAAGLAEAVAPVTAVALSQPVADALGALTWRDVAVADRPTQDALLAALDTHLPASAEPPMADDPPEDTPPPPPTPPASPPPASRAPMAIAVAAAIIALVAAIGATYPLWGTAVGLGTGSQSQRMDQVQSDFTSLKSQLAAQMTNLAKRQAEIGQRADANAKALDDAQKKLAALDDRVAKLAQSAGAAADLGQRLDALAKKIDALAGESEVANLAQSVKALEPRIAALEKAEKANAREGAGLVVAAAALAESVRTGQPYGTPLATISALAKNDPDIEHQVATLLPHAREGVPTQAALAARFPEIADAVTRAAIAPPGSSWIQRLVARLSSLVTIRRTGADAKGDKPSAIVARAEADLKAGDLSGAADEVKKLQGAPAQAASGWLDEAEARLDALGAAKAISDLAMKTYLHPDGEAAAPSPAPQPVPNPAPQPAPNPAPSPAPQPAPQPQNQAQPAQ